MSHLSRRSLIQATTFGLASLSGVFSSLAKPHIAINPNKRFPYFHSDPVSYLNVQMKDSFWAPRQKTTHDVTVQWVTQAHDAAGGLSEFKKSPATYVAKTRLGEMEHIKFIEAMASVVGVQADAAIEGLIHAWVKPMIEQQGADGYLAEHFPRGNNHPSSRWKPIWWSHEDYTVGHYLESAIGCLEVSDSKEFYRSAVRAVDNMASALLDGHHAYTSGHPEIEQALMRFYGVTGDAKYLQLCGWLLGQRGHHERRASYGRQTQDHLPIEDQRTIEGHAVRAAFLFNGATQYVGATGDSAYREAVLAVWDDLVKHKLYLHGVGGNISSRNEGYRRNPNCIPPDDCYGESCAVVGNIRWAHSLCRLTGDACYIDTAERMLYNAFSASISLSGDRSFYCNVSQTDPSDAPTGAVKFPHTRSSELATGCCPPNIVTLMNKVGGLFYSMDESGIYVNHYGACDANIPWGDGIRVIQRTEYPWDGNVTIQILMNRPQPFALRMRLPEWAKSHQLSVNGKMTTTSPERGWLSVRRVWKAGDQIELRLTMETERVEMPPEFEEYRNRVALKRGPIVFCLEQQDIDNSANYDSLASLYIPHEAKFTTEYRPGFLGGVTILKGEVRHVIGHHEYIGDKSEGAVFIPYGVWGNRKPGAMRIWLGARKDAGITFQIPQGVIGQSCLS